MQLTTKYTVVTGIVLVLTMILFATLNIHSLKKIYLRDASQEMDLLNETLILTTHYQMLEGDRQRVYQIIEKAGTQHGIASIRLINKSGIINFSTDKQEIGQSLEKLAEPCRMCHSSDIPLTQATTQNRSRVFTDASGREMLGIARAIYNEPSCYSADCHAHPQEKKVLGVLDIAVSQERMQSQMRTVQEGTLKLTLILLLLVALGLRLTTWRFIILPVRKLLDHTHRVTAGELSHRVDVPSKDELGGLARNFNAMTAGLEQTRQELKGLASTLETKVEERSRELEQIQTKLMRSEKLASLGELVAGIAHEINNPLTGILMYAAMVEDDPQLADTLKGDMQTVVRETQRCASIVQNLLNFSREVPPQKRRESINRLLEASLALVRNQPIFHDIEIVKDLEEGLPEIEVDPNQIEQVFVNLLINAGQAMPDGGILTLRTVRPAANLLDVVIGDTGIGISPGNLRRVFDPFFTTKGHRGTGLGLSVSYGILQNHGGQIDVESEVGQGTTFYLHFPIGRGRAD